MITLLKAILLMFALKGLMYLFFPGWVKGFYAESIIECPTGQLKMLGTFLVFGCLVLWLSWIRYL